MTRGKRGLVICFILLLWAAIVSCKTPDKIKELRTLLIQNEVQHVDIVIAQAILESGWFKCTNCSRELNNPFGFFWKGKYKKFRDLSHAVFYYKTWQDKWYKGGDYYVFLKKIGYAEDPGYINKLKRINKQLKE